MISKTTKIVSVIAVILLVILLSLPIWGKYIFSTTKAGYDLCLFIGHENMWTGDMGNCMLLGFQFNPPWSQR